MQAIRKRAYVGLAAMSVVGVSILPMSKSHAQAWTSASSLRVGENYDSNVRLVTPNAQADSNSLVDATWTLARRDDRLSLSLIPRLHYQHYQEQSLLDRTDKFVTLNGSYGGELSSWTGAANYVHDSTLTSELGLSGISEVNRAHESLTFNVGPTLQLTERSNLSLQGAWSQHRYERPEGTGLTDYDYGSASLSSGFALTSTTQLAISVSGGQLFLPLTGTATQTVNAQLQLSSELYSQIHWSLAAGPARVKTAIATDEGVSFSAKLQRETPRTTLGGELGRDVIPTGRGSLTVHEYVAINASYALSEYLSTSLQASWTHNRDVLSTPDVAATSVHYASVVASCRWHFLPTWSAWLSAGWVAQNYSLNADAAESWRGGIGFSWQSRERGI